MSPPSPPLANATGAELAQWRTHRMLTGDPKWLFWRLGLPLMFSFALQMSFTAVDRLFISWLDRSHLEQAALACAFPIELLMIALGSGISQGAASSVARLLGARNPAGAARAGAQALIVALVLTAVGLASAPFVPALIGHLATEPYVASQATRFTEILLLGSAAWFIPMIGAGILRGTGDMRTQMTTMLVSALCNVALGPILIFGVGPVPAMGLEGAALAAVLSRLVGASLVLAALLAPSAPLGRAIFVLMLDRLRLADLLRVGIPASLTTAISAIYLAILQGLLGQHHGPIGQAIAINGFTFEQLAFLPVLGLNIGLTTLVGQNHGAGRVDRERESLKWAYRFNLLLMSSIGLIYAIGAPALGWVFAGDNAAVAAGIADYLRINALGLPFSGLLLAIGSTFAGRGKGMPNLILQAVRMFAVALPLMAWLAPHGLSIMWWAMPTSVIAVTAVGVWWIHRDLRRDLCPPTRFNLQPAPTTSPVSTHLNPRHQ